MNSDSTNALANENSIVPKSKVEVVNVFLLAAKTSSIERVELIVGLFMKSGLSPEGLGVT